MWNHAFRRKTNDFQAFQMGRMAFAGRYWAIDSSLSSKVPMSISEQAIADFERKLKEFEREVIQAIIRKHGEAKGCEIIARVMADEKQMSEISD